MAFRFHRGEADDVDFLFRIKVKDWVVSLGDSCRLSISAYQFTQIGCQGFLANAPMLSTSSPQIIDHQKYPLVAQWVFHTRETSLPSCVSLSCPLSYLARCIDPYEPTSGMQLYVEERGLKV